MAKFIKLTRASEVLINIDHIIRISPLTTGCSIVLTDFNNEWENMVIPVRESFKEIEAKIRGAQNES